MNNQSRSASELVRDSMDYKNSNHMCFSNQLNPKSCHHYSQSANNTDCHSMDTEARRPLYANFNAANSIEATTLHHSHNHCHRSDLEDKFARTNLKLNFNNELLGGKSRPDYVHLNLQDENEDELTDTSSNHNNNSNSCLNKKQRHSYLIHKLQAKVNFFFLGLKISILINQRFSVLGGIYY